MNDEGTYVGGVFLLLAKLQTWQFNNNENDDKESGTEEIGGQTDKNERIY